MKFSATSAAHLEHGPPRELMRVGQGGSTARLEG